MFKETNTSGQGQQWERQTLQTILLEHIREQRRARRWSIFFKVLIFSIIIYFIFSSTATHKTTPIAGTQPHTALIDIKGEINSEDSANAETIREALENAFRNPLVKGIILRINSPGGTPVQARQIFDSIREFKAKKPEVKVYAVIEEVGASAAYLIAAAADEIYADQTSLVGSIGARMGSFGFVDAIHKLGIERRLYTTGKHKALLDPFYPEDPEEVRFIHQQLDIVLKAFVDNVKLGRGNRLKETPEIYSGYLWTGVTAKELGLIDGFGDPYFVAREIIKAPKLLDYSPKASILDKLANRLGASFAKAMFELSNGGPKALNLKD